jgi:hypothetical protein
VGQVQFSPVERRGVFMGATLFQIGVVAAGISLFLALALGSKDLVVTFLAAAVLGAAIAAVLIPYRGRTAAEWVPVMARNAVGHRRWTSSAPQMGERRRRGGVVRPVSVPPIVRGVRVLSTTVDGFEVGVLHHTARGTYNAVLPVAASSFPLLSPADQDRRQEHWGEFQAGLADGLTARLQWIVRAVPADPTAVSDYFEQNRDRSIADDDATLAGYRALVAGAPAVGNEIDHLLVVSVDSRRADARSEIRKMGFGDVGALALLAGEVERAAGQLRAAQVEAGRPLDVAGIVGRVRAILDPYAPAGVADESEIWPMAVEPGWDCVRVDGAWHRGYWIRSWPHRPVDGGVFLAPLLLRAASAGHVRTVSVTIEPVPLDKAFRQVEAAQMLDEVDDAERRRLGFLITARRRHQRRSVSEREDELVAGHADCLYSGFVVVSAPTREALEVGCAEAIRAARPLLRLEPAFGEHGEMLANCLPLAGGLKVSRW